MPATPTRAQETSDGPVRVTKAQGILVLQGKCPDRPDQCTCEVDSIQARATVVGQVGPAAQVSCELSVTLTTDGTPSGDVTVTLTAVSGILLPITTRTISAPSKDSPSSVGFDFLLLGATGLLDITIKHGSNSASIPRMTVTS